MDIAATGPAQTAEGAKPVSTETLATVELSGRISRRAYERICIHEIRSGKRKNLIVQELIMEHLPNWCIQERAKSAAGESRTSETEGQANPPVETKKDMPTGKDVLAKVRSRRAG